MASVLGLERIERFAIAYVKRHPNAIWMPEGMDNEVSNVFSSIFSRNAKKRTSDEMARAISRKVAEVESWAREAVKREEAAKDEVRQATERAIAAEDRVGVVQAEAMRAAERAGAAEARAVVTEDRAARAKERAIEAEERAQAAAQQLAVAEVGAARTDEIARAAESRREAAEEREKVAEARVKELEAAIIATEERARVADEKAEAALKAAEEQARVFRMAEERRRMLEEQAKLAQETRDLIEANWRKGVPPGVESLTRAQIQAARSSYQDGKVHIAIVGQSGVGKSTFTNAIRGLAPKEGDAAGVGENECTRKVTRYIDPIHQTYVWYDVPGAGTRDRPDWQYFMDMELYVYDALVVVFSDRIMQNDTRVLKNAQQLGISTFLVRTKSDQIMKNMLADGEEDSEIKERFVRRTREYIREELGFAGVDNKKVFLTSRDGLMQSVGRVFVKAQIVRLDEEELVRSLLQIGEDQ